ncbi:MAG: toxin-antitoxin system HicB family antitoxin [Planctomycetota bacterium]
MSTISLRLSESLHRRIRELARREGVSINQLINSAVAEKISALLTEEYLERRAKRGSRRKFDRALSKVRDVDPDPADRLGSKDH